MNHQQNTRFMEVPGSRRDLPIHPHSNCTPQDSPPSMVLVNDSIQQEKHHAPDVTTGHDDFSNLSARAIPKSAGTKRGRSGSPKTRHRRPANTQHNETSWSDTASYSDSDSGSEWSLEEYDTDGQDEPAHAGDIVCNEKPLPPTHPFQSFRVPLTLFIYSRFLVWMTSVRYMERPVYRLHNTKRVKTSGFPKMYREEEDPNDPLTILITIINGYYHLACPFFAFNQQKHLGCLVSHVFRSIEQLLDHILRDHKEPPFCPLCGTAFDTLKDRDDHLKPRTCVRRDHVEIDGVNHVQRLKLVRRDHSSLPDEERWCRMYATIFHCKHSGSVYLTEGIGLRISLLRDYWAKNGLLTVGEYLDDNGYGSASLEQGDEVSALGALVFQDLMVKLQEEVEG